MLESPSGQAIDSLKGIATMMQCCFKRYLWKKNQKNPNFLLKTLKLLLISSQSLRSWDRLRTLLSRQEGTQRQREETQGRMPCDERGGDRVERSEVKEHWGLLAPSEGSGRFQEVPFAFSQGVLGPPGSSQLFYRFQLCTYLPTKCKKLIRTPEDHCLLLPNQL